MKPYRLLHTSGIVNDIVSIELQKRYCFFWFKTIDRITYHAYLEKWDRAPARSTLLFRNRVLWRDCFIVEIKHQSI